MNKFYNVAKSENRIITPEENLVFAGLGKKFICIGFPYMINHFDINPNETLIILQASGGDIRTETDKYRVQQYVSLGTSNILQIYYNKYPEDFKNSNILLNKYSDLRLSEKLIQYYTAAFGFQPITYISMETIMGTLISIFLDNRRSTNHLSS